jgi:D-alanyl-D-alanine carboxypeptidase/D-alanyl-D-alanine-endopeptidase (penicillin-binding protein 4)
MLGKLLRDALVRRGLVATPSVTVRLAQMAETFPGEKTFAVVATPLATVLQRCNTDSQNLYAEALVKRIANQVTGQPGSWANGTTVVRGKLIETLGADIGDVRLSDGSGLSRDNTVPPLTLARWLAALHRNDHLRKPMLESMATADDGRLEGRFKDRRLTARVHAKTGYIRGVLCLSGYVTLESPTDHADDRTLAFSILINNTQSSISQARELQEDIVQALDRHLVRNAPKAQPALGG